MARYIVDSCVLIEAYSNGQHRQKCADALRRYRDTLVFVEPVLLELLCGSANAKQQSRWLKLAEVLLYERATRDDLMRAQAIVKRTLPRRAVALDFVIGAIALRIGGIVMTLNLEDFQSLRVPCIAP